MCIWVQLALGKTGLVHPALGRLIHQCEDVSREAAKGGLR
jgi:hypothetical protein